ncbi:MAG: DUF2059 domain-containing protein [Tannerella sp.]|jgi:preprotein translocase subunit SecD|nr:DUF2059 domain-containing protein [Tannerella sp.]
MKNIKVLTQVLFILFSAVCYGQSKEQKIESILNTGGNLDAFRSVFESRISVLKYNANEEDSIKLAEIERKITKEVITERFITVYKEFFSDSEIDEIYRFFNSQTGKKLIDSVDIFADKINENFKDIMDEIKTLEDKMYDYQEDEEETELYPEDMEDAEETAFVPTDKEDGFYAVISFPEGTTEEDGLKEMTLGDEPEIGIDDISGAERAYSEWGMAVINIQLTEEGTEKFKVLTEKNIGKRIAIILDKKIVSAPVVTGVIAEGKIQISGMGTLQEMDEIVDMLNRNK